MASILAYRGGGNDLRSGPLRLHGLEQMFKEVSEGVSTPESVSSPMRCAHAGEAR
jgi:hypothetical protein